MQIPNPRPGDRAEWMQAATSPMMLGLILSKHHKFRGMEGQEFTPYPHIQELDRILKALCDGHLWDSGPGAHPLVRAYYRPIESKPTDTGLREVIYNDWFDRVGSTIDDPGGPGIDTSKWVLHKSEAFHPSHPNEEIVTRLGVFLPIRHGKSLMCSVLLPVWYLLQNAATSVMVVGHTKDFGQGELGRRVQTFLFNYMGTMGLQCADSKLSREKMNFKYQQHMSTIMFSGVDVGVLGMAKRLGVLDDPVKKLTDMESEAFRHRQYVFYGDEWLGRATLVPGQPPPVDVNVMSRVAMDDLAGKFMIEDGHMAKARPGYFVLHRQGLVVDEYGEHSLCEPMVTTERLLEAREKTPEMFQAQYQNDPRPVQGLGFPPLDEWPTYTLKSGGTFEGYPVYRVDGIEEDVHVDVRFASIDLSGKVTKRSDFTVVAIWDYNLKHDRLMLRDLKRLRMEAADHMFEIKELCAVPGEEPVEYAVTENVPLSYNLLQSAERDAGFLGFDLWSSFRPGGMAGPKAMSKQQRFRVYADAVEDGRVVLPLETFDLAWWMEFKKEHEGWPKVAHDDQLDVCADAVFETQRIKENNPRESSSKKQVARDGKWVYNREDQEELADFWGQQDETWHPLSAGSSDDWNMLGI